MFPRHITDSRLSESMLSSACVLAFMGDPISIGLGFAVNVANTLALYYRYTVIKNASNDVNARPTQHAWNDTLESGVALFTLLGCLAITANPLVNLSIYLGVIHLVAGFKHFERHNVQELTVYQELDELEVSTVNYDTLESLWALLQACAIPFALNANPYAALAVLTSFCLRAGYAATVKERATAEVADTLSRAATFLAIALLASPGLTACFLMTFAAPIVSAGTAFAMDLTSTTTVGCR